MTLVGVDVGGTFTDAVALVDGRIVTAKVPSTPRDQSDGAGGFSSPIMPVPACEKPNRSI